jgi:hypothetical protein
MIDDCTADDCTTPYSPPEKRGNPPHDKWVRLINGELDKVYQIRLRVRKEAALSGSDSQQNPEYRCRTGIFTLCPRGMQQFTSTEVPWLNIQLSDELTLDGPNVLIAKGFTHLVPTGTDSTPAVDTGRALPFKNVNGELMALCSEEKALNLGPTWFAAKFSWPSPREDCPAECPAMPTVINPTAVKAP